MAKFFMIAYGGLSDEAMGGFEDMIGKAVDTLEEAKAIPIPEFKGSRSRNLCDIYRLDERGIFYVSGYSFTTEQWFDYEDPIIEL